MTAERESLFLVGQRVKIGGEHHYAGQTGTIINTPGKVFNGWNVCTDKGIHVGVATRQLRKVES